MHSPKIPSTNNPFAEAAAVSENYLAVVIILDDLIGYKNTGAPGRLIINTCTCLNAHKFLSTNHSPLGETAAVSEDEQCSSLPGY